MSELPYLKKVRKDALTTECRVKWKIRVQDERAWSWKGLWEEATWQVVWRRADWLCLLTAQRREHRMPSFRALDVLAPSLTQQRHKGPA